jgi:hypothetical protein
MELLRRLKEEFGEQRILELEKFMGDYILVQLGLEGAQAVQVSWLEFEDEVGEQQW